MFVGECFNTLANKLNKSHVEKCRCCCSFSRKKAINATARLLLLMQCRNSLNNTATKRMKTPSSQANKRPFIIIWVTFRQRTSSENSWENRLILFAVLKSCWMHFWSVVVAIIYRHFVFCAALLCCWRRRRQAYSLSEHFNDDAKIFWR